MKYRNISTSKILKNFLWLEYKKWTRIIDAVPNSSLFFYFGIFLEVFLIIYLRYHIRLLGGNPRAVVMMFLLIFFLSIFILSCQAFIVPASGGPELFPLNPFNFKLADLSIISQISSKPLTLAFIGWIRTTLKVSWYVFLLSLFVYSYGFELKVQGFYLVSTILTLFLGIHLTMLSGAFVYTFVEEVIEYLRPRWREQNISGITTISKILVIIILLGGLALMMGVSKTNVVNFENLILQFWYIPPFNVIYLVISFLSWSWPRDLIILSFSSLFLQWFAINILFFLVLNKIDPLTRLYERLPLSEFLSSDFDTPMINIMIFTSLTHLKFRFPRISRFQPCFSSEITGLFKKDLLLLDKYRISFIYSLVFILISVVLVFWTFSEFTIHTGQLFLVPLIPIVITLMIWIKESKTLQMNLKISNLTLITEKWLLSFTLAIVIHLPLLLMRNVNLFLTGLGVYYLSFCFGFIYHYLKPSRP